MRRPPPQAPCQPNKKVISLHNKGRALILLKNFEVRRGHVPKENVRRCKSPALNFIGSSAVQAETIDFIGYFQFSGTWHALCNK